MNGRFQYTIDGPVCRDCGQPMLVCYTDPCPGALDKLADAIRADVLKPSESPPIVLAVPHRLTTKQRKELRAAWNGQWFGIPSKDSVLLVAGGQGRTRGEVLDCCNTLALIVVLFLFGVCVLAVMP